MGWVAQKRQCCKLHKEANKINPPTQVVHIFIQNVILSFNASAQLTFVTPSYVKFIHLMYHSLKGFFTQQKKKKHHLLTRWINSHIHSLTMAEVYTVKVEDARPATHEKPSAGPVYRCIYAKDSLTELPSHFESPWDFFRCVTFILN